MAWPPQCAPVLIDVRHVIYITVATVLDAMRKAGQIWGRQGSLGECNSRRRICSNGPSASEKDYARTGQNQ